MMHSLVINQFKIKFYSALHFPSLDEEHKIVLQHMRNF